MTDIADHSRAEPAGAPRARQMLDRAHWAARAYATYDHASVVRIAEAVARVAEDNAERYAQWEVEETGFGVVADKTIMNRSCSRGILDAHRDHDFVTPRVDSVLRTVELPRPAGVVLALPPATSPVATSYVQVVLALLTRNAVVVSPDPSAKRCVADVARVLAEAAVEAGAPDGVVQVVEEPSTPLVDELAADERVDVVVRPLRANVPVFVDATADLPRAAAELVASKTFDNSLPSTNESVLVVEEAVADRLLREMERHGAQVLDRVERDRLRDALFPRGLLERSLVGRDAAGIAGRAGVRVASGTRILVAPIDLAVDEEPLTHEKPCPVLGVVRVPTARRGIRAAATVVRIGGAGQSAVIHSSDARAVMDYAAALDVLRVVVNAGGSNPADPLAELQPERLVRSVRVDVHASALLDGCQGVVPWSAPTGPVPSYPVARTVLRGAADGGRR